MRPVPTTRAAPVRAPASRSRGAMPCPSHMRIPTATRATPPAMRRRAPMPLPGPVTASTWDHASAAPHPMTISGPAQSTSESTPTRHRATRTAASRRAPPPRRKRRRVGIVAGPVGRAASRARMAGTEPAASAHGSPTGTVSHSSRYSRTPAPPAKAARTKTARTTAADASRWTAMPEHTPVSTRPGRLRDPPSVTAGRPVVPEAGRRGSRRRGSGRGAASAVPRERRTDAAVGGAADRPWAALVALVGIVTALS